MSNTAETSAAAVPSEKQEIGKKFDVKAAGLIIPESEKAFSETSPGSVSPPAKNEDPGPAPDGGIRAWNQALVAHLVIFNTWGYINSFGVFQTYYLQILDRPPADISWIGSIQVFLLFFIGAVSGRATDAGHYRLIFITGSIFLLLGMFTTSVCTEYWQFMLAQGICVGIGCGLLFCPTLALIPTYFSKKRAIAVGIAASGTTTGGMIIPGIFEGLLPRVGFGWTVRVLAFVTLAFQLLSFALARTRIPPRKTGNLLELSAFKEAPYALFTIGVFLCFLSVYPAYYYVGEFATTVIGVSQGNSFNLLIVMNGIGAIGRLLPPWISDRYTGPTNMMIPMVVLSAVTLYCWVPIYNEAGLWAFSVFYGLFSSAVNGLFPTALSRLTDDLSKMGTRMGMVFSTISFATLVGTPITGALITHMDGNYLGAQMFAASIMLGGAIFLILARTAKVGLKLRVKM
jgi:MFS family permease